MTTPAAFSPSIPALAVLDQASTPTSAVNQAEQANFAKVVTAGFSTRANLLAENIDAAGGQPGIEARLEAQGPNPAFTRADTACEEQLLSARLAIMLAQESAAPLNLLAALRALQAHLEGLSYSDLNVVVTANLVQATPSFTGSAAKAVRNYEAQELVPSCPRWHLYLLDSTPTAVSGERTLAINAFWRALAAGCGGDVRVLDTQLTAFPVTANQPSLPSVPPVAPITVRTDGDGVTATLPTSVLFNLGQATLTLAATHPLADLLRLITTKYPTGTVTVQGFTDSLGSPDANQVLSTQRAVAVATWLADHGIPAARLQAQGLGEEDPVAPNQPTGQPLDRRVQLVLHAGD